MATDSNEPKDDLEQHTAVVLKKFDDLRDDLQRRIDGVIETTKLFRKIEADNCCLRQQVDELKAELEKARATPPPAATGARHAGRKEFGPNASANVNHALYLWAAVAMRQPGGASCPGHICHTVWDALRASAPSFRHDDWEYPARLWRWAKAVQSVLDYADNKAFFRARVVHSGNCYGSSTNLELAPQNDASNHVYNLWFHGNKAGKITTASVSWDFTNLAEELIPGDLERFLLQL